MKTTLIKCNHAVVVYSTSVSLCGVTVRDIAHNNTGLWLVYMYRVGVAYV